jgi:peroxin-6
MNTRFTMSPALSLQNIAAQLPFTYTGADFYALCSDAMLKAVTRQASAVDAKIAAINATRELPISTAHFFDYYGTKEDIAVLVTEEDFMAAQRELIPSVSAKELEHYRRVREQFESIEKKKSEKEGAPAAGNGTVASPKAPHSPVTHRFSPRTNGRLRNKGKGKGKARDGVDEEDDHDDGFIDGPTNGTSPTPVLPALMNGFRAGDLMDDAELY